MWMWEMWLGIILRTRLELIYNRGGCQKRLTKGTNFTRWGTIGLIHLLRCVSNKRCINFRPQSRISFKALFTSRLLYKGKCEPNMWIPIPSASGWIKNKFIYIGSPCLCLQSSQLHRRWRVFIPQPTPQLELLSSKHAHRERQKFSPSRTRIEMH